MGLIFYFFDIDAMGGPKFKRKKKAYPADYKRKNNSQATLVSTVGLAMRGGKAIRQLATCLSGEFTNPV